MALANVCNTSCTTHFVVYKLLHSVLPQRLTRFRTLQFKDST